MHNLLGLIYGLLFSTILLCGCDNRNKTLSINVETKFGEGLKALYNATIIVKDGDLFEKELIKKNNDSIIIFYTEKGNTFTDYNNYEDNYELVLFFTIPVNVDSMKWINKGLEAISPQFVYNCYSKKPIKEKRNIRKGTIEIKKILDQSLLVNINIDTEFKFGGYFDKKGSSIIKVKKQLVRIDSLDKK